MREHLVNLDRFSLHVGMQLSCRCVASCRKLASIRAAMADDDNCDCVVSTCPTKPKLLRSCVAQQTKTFWVFGKVMWPSQQIQQQYCHRALELSGKRSAEEFAIDDYDHTKTPSHEKG